MGAARRRRPWPYSCIPLSGPKAAKTSLRWGSVSLSSVSSSWLRRKIAQPASGGTCGSSRMTVSSGSRRPGARGPPPGEARLRRPGLRARERQPQVLVDQEGELHVQLVAVLAEVTRQLVEAEVDLAEQQRVTAPAARERPQAAQPLLWLVFVHVLGHAAGLQQRRHRVHPEARHPELEPEPDDPRDLVADRGVGRVQVGLEVVEAVQVVLARGLVVAPVAGLCTGEREALRLVGRLIAPDV